MVYILVFFSFCFSSSKTNIERLHSTVTESLDGIKFHRVTILVHYHFIGFLQTPHIRYKLHHFRQAMHHIATSRTTSPAPHIHCIEFVSPSVGNSYSVTLSFKMVKQSLRFVAVLVAILLLCMPMAAQVSAQMPAPAPYMRGPAFAPMYAPVGAPEGSPMSAPAVASPGYAPEYAPAYAPGPMSGM